MSGVLLGWCHPESISGRFTNSLAALLDYDFNGARRIVGTAALQSGPRVAEARSQIVDHFGQHPAKPDWLLMLDADMVFPPDLLDQMFEHADPDTVPFLGALCFAGVHGARIFPTLYRAYNEEDGHVAVEPVEEYQRDALVRVGATGAACVLMHRRVFAAMRRPGPKAGEKFDPTVHGFGTLPNGKENAYPWYCEGWVTNKGIAVGEDIALCRRAMQLGIPMHVHTGIKVGHVKSWTISEDDFDTYRREKNRNGPLLDAAVQVLRESGRFAPDELSQVIEYLRPRPSILSDTERPKPKPFLLPEPALT